ASAKKTTDGGATWTAYTPTGNFWTSDLVAVPNTGIYVCSGAATGLIGTSFSEDSGSTWVDIETGTVQYTALGASSFNGLWAGGFSGGFQAGGIFKWDGAPMAIEENAVNLKTYNLYPNPTSGIVTLNLKSKSSTATVQVIDVMGKLVYSQNCSGTMIKKSFDFSALAKGIYSLVIISANEKTTEKLVIQ
ncbi:MAG: T9SS type A sorting domain-containing protein, partial [Bacteroidota bacterium]